ncbi:ABC transporter ATP-binding protein [Actinomadura rayongensis]|uniref:ATP-binding cassette domain-containing protein n=1 Tax=Actinomadura rayongensis TaxID=1429076 RepID=A0A6I4W989_9ACTN|nr:ATP-binding cassette domain-containing protein [Actinomadura rayongensis]MXQ66151.1 ATP-binding cassette domain-containing protein [Actinomadura rayongensis]
MTHDTTVRATGLGKTYDPSAGPVLAGVDVAFAAGELCALMGPPGAGRSTLLGCLAGYVPPSTGAVHLTGGRSPVLLRGVRRSRIGFVAPHARPFPRETVASHLRWSCALAGTPHDPYRAARVAWLLGLGGVLGTPVARLTARDRRLVLCAGALLPGPRLVTVDAPDAAAPDAAFFERLRRATAGLGTGVVAVTGDSAAAAVADRVVFVERGRIAGAVHHPHDRPALPPLAG